jgi:hypothetical protein
MTMRAKILKLGSMFLAGALATLGPAAHADNINTSGTVCQNFNAGQALDIDYLANGVRNINPSPRPVVCAVPRSPLQPTATAAQFFIDGVNAAGTTTSCTLFVYTFGGAISQSSTFTLPGFVSLPLIGPFDYVSVLCTLPGNPGTVLFGATSVQ